MDPSSSADSGPSTVALSSLEVGQRASLRGSRVAPEDARLLSALGLETGAEFRLCKKGGPWIVQVGATRIGLAPEIARRLMVQPAA